MNYKKIEKRVQSMFDNCELDNDIISTKISKENVQRLMDYQIVHTLNLLISFIKNQVVLDGSSTGTGKTYTSICVCKELGLRPLIICPLSITSVWKSVCDYFDVHPIAIVNYEMIRTGKIKTKIKDQIKFDENDKNNENNENNKNNDLDKILKIVDGKYEWNFSKNTLVIMDEVHKCKNKNSLNGQLLISLKNKVKLLMLSATVADKPENFNVFGYMLGFYKNISKSRNWISSIIRDDNNRLDLKTSTLYEKLYPEKGARMSMDDIGIKFPKNHISVTCYTLNEKDQQEINAYYQHIQNKKELNNEHLSVTTILKCRQKIEFLKISIIVELIKKYLEIGKSIVVFVNFLNTLNGLEKVLKRTGLEYSSVQGGQSLEQRDIEINKFQANNTRIIICTMQSGSQSISLHDIHGNAPRVSLILPSFSSIDLIQAFGRIYRVGLKTPAIQKIILCDDVYEKLICEKIKEKLQFNIKLAENDTQNKVTKDLLKMFDNNNLEDLW